MNTSGTHSIFRKYQEISAKNDSRSTHSILLHPFGFTVVSRKKTILISPYRLTFIGVRRSPQSLFWPPLSPSAVLWIMFVAFIRRSIPTAAVYTYSNSVLIGVGGEAIFFAVRFLFSFQKKSHILCESTESRHSLPLFHLSIFVFAIWVPSLLSCSLAPLCQSDIRIC